MFHNYRYLVELYLVLHLLLPIRCFIVLFSNWISSCLLSFTTFLTIFEYSKIPVVVAKVTCQNINVWCKTRICYPHFVNGYCHILLKPLQSLVVIRELLLHPSNFCYTETNSLDLDDGRQRTEYWGLKTSESVLFGNNRSQWLC